MSTTCVALNKDGTFCRYKAKAGNSFCGRHLKYAEASTAQVLEAAASIADIDVVGTIDDSIPPIIAPIVAEAEPAPVAAPPVSQVVAVVEGPNWEGLHLYDQKEMQNLASREYKYTGIDLSPLALYVLHPYWNKVVTFVPFSISYVALSFIPRSSCISANLLTVLGGVCFIAAYILMFWNNPDFSGSREWWQYAVAALATWTYQTLDGIDGKHGTERFISFFTFARALSLSLCVCFDCYRCFGSCVCVCIFLAAMF